MDIRVASLLDGARNAAGAVVVIDVYRAFTTAAVAFARGAERIVLASDVDRALALRRAGAGELCVGEVHGVMPHGFDYNNSPRELSLAHVAGKTLILSTRAGTTGIEAARQADRLYAGPLVTALSTARVLRNNRPRLVTLVAMGWEGRVRTEEDELCALYMRNLLRGRRTDTGAVRRLILDAEESQKFDDPTQAHFHPADRDIALQINRFPFAMRVERDAGLQVLRREDVP